MEVGQVRCILWSHLRAHDATADVPGSDPNALVPADPLAKALQAYGAKHGEDALRALGADYSQLWHRTFRRLVRHHRGRPDLMLALFTREVFPYLRGDPLAARLESRRTVRLRDDLPAAYLQGLLEGFIGLTGATATANQQGDVWHIQIRLAARHRLAATARTLAALRIPLLVVALLAMAAGFYSAVPAAPQLIAVVAGVLGAQLGANALPDLRHRATHMEFRMPENVARTQLVVGGVLAFGALVYLLPSAPLLPYLALAGVAASGAYPWLRDRGFGTALLVLHAILIAGGAAHVAGASLAAGFLAGAPVGLAAAALAHLADVADRPVDMAQGRRTLAVRLPTKSDAWLYGAFLGASALAILPYHIAGALLLGALAPALAILAARSMDTPSRLAPLRLATMAYAALIPLILLGATP